MQILMQFLFYIEIGIPPPIDLLENHNHYIKAIPLIVINSPTNFKHSGGPTASNFSAKFDPIELKYKVLQSLSFSINRPVGYFWGLYLSIWHILIIFDTLIYKVNNAEITIFTKFVLLLNYNCILRLTMQDKRKSINNVLLTYALTSIH